MKKILSILLAAMLAFSALGATSMMAFAASNTVASPEHTIIGGKKQSAQGVFIVILQRAPTGL